MARQEPRSREFGTISIVAVAVFLLAWNVVERVTGTGPRGAPTGATYHAANQAGERWLRAINHPSSSHDGYAALSAASLFAHSVGDLFR